MCLFGGSFLLHFHRCTHDVMRSLICWILFTFPGVSLRWILTHRTVESANMCRSAESLDQFKHLPRALCAKTSFPPTSSPHTTPNSCNLLQAGRGEIGYWCYFTKKKQWWWTCISMLIMHWYVRFHTFSVDSVGLFIICRDAILYMIVQ